MARAGHIRCAIYTRTSTDERLGQDFNSLDAQREAAEAYIASQKSEGWTCLPTCYDDGGFSGGTVERPALRRLLADVEAGEIDCVVIYKIDRLSRSLLDFAKIAQTLQCHSVSFVAVTQQFSTSTSMGRLMMNVLLSFAQFERELASERTRDKIAATRRKGKWSGGRPILGYDIDRSGGSPRLAINPVEADRVREIFELYLEYESLIPVVSELNSRGWCTKRWVTKKGSQAGGQIFDKHRLYGLLTNALYVGKVRYREELHDGEHDQIVGDDVWQRVQATLRRNGRTGGRDARNKYGALLRGLLRCGTCGCAMTHTYSTKGARRYRYYTCARAQKQGWHTCETKSVPAGEIEAFVVNQIRCIGEDEGLVKETIAEAQRAAEEGLARLASEKVSLIDDLRRDHAAVRETVDDMRRADLNERVAGAERRLRQVELEIAAMRDGMVAEEEIRTLLSDFDRLWCSLSPAEQVRILESLVERVEYDGAAGTVSVTYQATGITTTACGS